MRRFRVGSLDLALAGGSLALAFPGTGSQGWRVKHGGASTDDIVRGHVQGHVDRPLAEGMSLREYRPASRL
jgi:hypothetical protein